MAAAVAHAVGTLTLAQSCGICPQGNESGAVGDFPQSLLAVQTYPVGNPSLTYAALSVVGATGQDDEREFLLSLGLVSNRGNQVTFSCACNLYDGRRRFRFNLFLDFFLLSPPSTSGLSLNTCLFSVSSHAVPRQGHVVRRHRGPCRHRRHLGHKSPRHANGSFRRLQRPGLVFFSSFVQLCQQLQLFLIY